MTIYTLLLLVWLCIYYSHIKPFIFWITLATIVTAVFNYVTSFYQRTALHIAARKGQKYTVIALIEKGGASINVKDKSGVSVLIHFLGQSATLNYFATYLARGHSVQISQNLHIWATTWYQIFNFSVVHILFKSRWILKVLSLNQMTPLHMAAEAGYFDIMKYLVEKNADTASKNKDGVSCCILVWV